MTGAGQTWQPSVPTGISDQIGTTPMDGSVRRMANGQVAAVGTRKQRHDPTMTCTPSRIRMITLPEQSRAQEDKIVMIASKEATRQNTRCIDVRQELGTLTAEQPKCQLLNANGEYNE
ncbi:hypothetical protein R1flu_003006 [Riccia fluitans]|uniref:Uncharacterized protein n=1 Tax=Riccia fluitans TaxID=41844 RepID=A0ABD1Y841_9MARC